MPTALSLAPLTLAAVLVLSGVAKLGDPGSTASMIRLLRLPAFLGHRVVLRTLPVVELATALLLLTPWRWTYAAGAALSLALFAAFLVVVARAMTFNPRPTCGCFGRVGDHRITARTVWRNVLLLVLALVTAGIAVSGTAGGALVARYDTGDWLWLALAAALAAVAVLVLGGSGPSGGRPGPSRPASSVPASQTVHPDAELDYVRAPIPRGVLLAPDLRVSSLHALAHQRAQLLVLANCWCGSTMETIEKLPSWRQRLPQLDVQLVHTHRPWDEPALSGLDGVWWDPGSAVYDALQAGVSPAAVLLGADGLLAGGPVSGVASVEEFVDDIIAELTEAEQASAEVETAEVRSAR